MNISEVLRYSDWTKQRLRQAVEEIAEVWTRQFDTIADYKTVRDLTAHIAGAEERLMHRIQGKPRPQQGYEQRAGSSIQEVFSGWDAIRAITREFIAGAGPDDLAAVHHLSFPQSGFEGDKTVEQLLFHIFNHQTYHLAQISTTLQRYEIEPPNFDYILLPE